MSNMGYCRFRNTLADLRDCQNHLPEELPNDCQDEKDAKEGLIRLCKDIAEEFEDD